MDILSIFGIRGRPKEVHHLNDAIRKVGIQPSLVADSVKISVIKLLREAEGGNFTDIVTSCEKAAPMVVYCMLGREDYEEVNNGEAADEIEKRLSLAINSGDSLDAQLIMLTLFANIAHPAVIEKFDLNIR
tara:strand:- start:744 stop:1136 length:393 start_codon:yes stop_codon:yes gene_type:complete